MNEAKILEQTYFDEAMILRLQKVKNSETGQTNMEEIVVASNVKCAVSRDSNPTINNGDISSVNYSAKLFCGPGIDIKPGDKIKVLSLGEIVSYVAGESFKYISHMETPLTRKERV